METITHTHTQTVIVSYNEDVEVGRCVSRMLELQCTWAWEVSEYMCLYGQ